MNFQGDPSTYFPCTTNYKISNIIKRFYLENSPLEGTVQSGQSAIMQYVRRVMMGFEQKLSKKNILIQFTKSPVRPANSKFCQRQNLRCELSRKRSQNHFRLHFTSKTPYSSDTRGIFLKYTRMRFSRTTKNNNKQRDKKDQIDILANNHDKKYNSTKHLKGLQFFIYEDVY